MHSTPAARLTRKEKIAQGLPKLAGSRKHRMAEARKTTNSQLVYANLSNQPFSPRKFRLVLDQVRGRSLEEAFAITKLSTRAPSKPLQRLLKTALESARHKWGESISENDLYVKTITADQTFMLKRVLPAPQGRAYRVRKRYSNVRVELGRLSDLQTS